MGEGRIWWILPLVFAFASVGCSITGLLVARWMVLTQVVHTSGRMCEIVGTQAATVTSTLMGGEFCDGEYGCRIYMILLTVIGVSGAGVMAASALYGTTLHMLQRRYDMIFNAGLLAAMLLLNMVTTVWMAHAAQFTPVPRVDYRCSGIAFYFFAASGSLAVCAFCALHTPMRRLMTDHPPTHASHRPHDSDEETAYVAPKIKAPVPAKTVRAVRPPPGVHV
jgi:hypothetical protein